MQGIDIDANINIDYKNSEPVFEKWQKNRTFSSIQNILIVLAGLLQKLASIVFVMMHLSKNMPSSES